MSAVHTTHVDILLPDYVQGSLGSEDAGTVEEHLRQCETCRLATEEIRKAFDAVGHAGKPEVSKSYFSSVLPRVRQRIDQRNRSVWNNAPLVAKIGLPAGAAALLVALLWLAPLKRSIPSSENPLQAVVDSASSEDIAEILQQDIPSHEWNSFGDSVMTNALANDRFVKRELVQEALTSETNSPFDVFSGVSPQQILSSLDENETVQILQQLKMETL